MYICKQCEAHNPLDSKFCKNCGVALPEDELEASRLALDEVIETGHSYFKEGRTEEALMIAESAAEANPSSSQALSLKGLCCERLGQIAEALECYEAAVALNPDSTIDKIKIGALRNKLAGHVVTYNGPDKRKAFLVAASAAVACLAIGSLIAFSVWGRPTKGEVASNGQNSVKGFIDGAGQGQNQPQQQTNQPTDPNSANSQNQTQGQAPPSGSSQLDNQGAMRPPINWNSLGAPSGSGLPDVNQSNVVGPIGEEPIHPPAPQGGGDGTSVDPAPSVGNAGQGNPGGQANQGGNAATNNGGSTPAVPKDDPGIIEIKLADSPSKPNQPGAEPVQESDGESALRRAGTNQFQVGDYAGAASTFKKLISMGGAGGSAYQRLGQCYVRLGKAQAASSAFNSAVQAFQSEIKAGRNVGTNQAGLNACLQELKLLGGN